MVALRTGLSFCVVDDVALFLDAPADRYFAFNKHASRQFLNLVDAITCGASVDQGLTDAFMARGVLTNGPSEGWRMAPGPRRPIDEWQRPRDVAPPAWGMVGLALLCILLTRIRLRLLPFHAIIRDRTSLESPDEPVPSLPDRAIVAFLVSLRLWPSALDCLPRSIALRTFLTCLGARSTLVLAVKLHPFGAHCWVQVADRVIGDTLEQVGIFTPIRSVR